MHLGAQPFQCQLVSNLTPSQSRVHSHSRVEAYARCEHPWVGFVGGTLEPCLPYQVWNPTACPCQFSSVQFSCSVVSDSLRPHGLQPPRLPCPSPTPGVCSNSYPSSRLCHPIISASVVPFSFCLQSFPASGSFQMSQFFASVLSMNIQDWFPLGLSSLISLQYKGLSRVISSTIVRKHQYFGAQSSLWSNSHIHTWLLVKPLFWLDGPLSAK